MPQNPHSIDRGENDLTWVSLTTRSFLFAAATRSLGLTQDDQPKFCTKKNMNDTHCFRAPNLVLNPIASHIGINWREVDPLLTLPTADTILLDDLDLLLVFEKFLPFRFA